jgi:hypothetical protein
MTELTRHTERLPVEEEPQFCEDCHICHVGPCHGFGHEWPEHQDAFTDEERSQ